MGFLLFCFSVICACSDIFSHFGFCYLGEDGCFICWVPSSEYLGKGEEEETQMLSGAALEDFLVLLVYGDRWIYDSRSCLLSSCLSIEHTRTHLSLTSLVLGQVDH